MKQLPDRLCELEVLPGLADLAAQELADRFGNRVRVEVSERHDTVPFTLAGSLRELLDLRIAGAAYEVLRFDAPRPKALLGHQHLTRILHGIDRVRGMHPSGAFHSFRFSAAGRDSAVFQRLSEEIAGYTHLSHEDENADLLMRVRPGRSEGSWELLLRLSPRPLTTRSWRVCDWPGAINAGIAAGMTYLLKPGPHQRFLNLMAGSGTLLIERLAWGPAALAAGCDIDPETLACARLNIEAAGLTGQVDLREMDCTAMDFPAASFDALAADLPWGNLVGSVEENEALYPALLREAGRVARPGAKMAVVSGALTQLEKAVGQVRELWTVRESRRVLQGGLTPRLLILERKE